MTEMEVTGLLFKLADIGITGVFISYEGSGDSGNIEAITYTKEEIHDITDLEVIYDNGIEFNNNLDNQSGLKNEIENFAYDALLNDIEDWYNNDGGFGYVILHVQTGDYQIFNSVRYYQTKEYIHTGKLTEKATENE
jgi:hypothetical protein